jgi:regulator of protease activity HflC (stomatin/prohibitin superfamily)
MDTMGTVGLVVLGILALVALILVVKTLYTVRTYTAGVVERFGKFARAVQRGDQDARQRVCADPGERAVPDSAGQDL